MFSIPRTPKATPTNDLPSTSCANNESMNHYTTKRALILRCAIRIAWYIHSILHSDLLIPKLVVAGIIAYIHQSKRYTLRFDRTELRALLRVGAFRLLNAHTFDAFFYFDQ